jgi:D-alanyl-D-alanine carboxypeptidase/D-alanyl-D-alanine-endopeptidase (penicillin-binding protein 4)
MRRRGLGAIVGATAALVIVAGYAVADARDLVPGVLTASDAPEPADPPELAAQSGPVMELAQSGEGAAVAADSVTGLWSGVSSAASEGSWKAWGMVMDAATGEVLLDASSSSVHTPASTTKILTAVSALSHLDETATLATGASLEGTDLYLWGQGDLMLARGEGDPDAVDGRAGVADLAEATAAALEERGITQVTLRWNHEIFTGASHLPAWDAQDSGDFEGRVGAFAIDGGRETPGSDQGFADDPGRDVAAELAADLRGAGIEAVITGESAVPDGAQEIARVESATIGQQVRWMLHHSDNTLADQFCRLAAAAAGAEPSYAGAASTVAQTLTSLGVDTTGLVMEDCSGLSTNDRISAKTLVGALDASMGADAPALGDLVRSLPWGGLDGTLDTRFSSGPAAANVQAKTGSLPTVSSLAGVVTTSGGRTLVFAVGNDEVPDDGAYWTRAPLDEFVQGLAGL